MTSGQWSDLAPRVISGAAMIIAFGFAIWMGGWTFWILVAVLGGLMVWETTRMFHGRHAIAIGIVSGAALAVSMVLPSGLAPPVLLAVVLAGVGQVKQFKLNYALLCGWILFGCFVFVLIREKGGLLVLAWLALVIVLSDILGYFAGRTFGGPKFWPRISPKKTWSGTVAGWIGAACVGIVFAKAGPNAFGLVVASVLICVSGQMGDIAQSAAKRKQGVKDSSNLIPGHGGVFDRFDAFLGATIMVVLLYATGLLPELS